MVHGMGLLGPLFAFLTSTSNMPGGFMDRSVYLWPWDIRVYICHWRWGAECTMLFANQKAGDPSGLVWEVIMTTQLDLWSRCYDGAKGLRQWCAQEMPIQLQWVWESQLGLTIVYRRYRLVCILLESSQIPVRSGSAKWQSLVDVPKDSSNVRSELHVVSLKMICQMRGLRPYYTSIYIDPTIHPSYWNHLELATETLTRDKAPILYHFECSCNLTALAALSCILVVDSVNPFSSAVWRTVHFSVLTARGQYISVGSQGRPVSFCRCAVYWRYSSNYWTATSPVKKKQKKIYIILFFQEFFFGASRPNWSRCIHCIQTEVTVAKFENPVHECRNDAPLPPYSKKSIFADLDF